MDRYGSSYSHNDSGHACTGNRRIRFSRIGNYECSKLNTVTLPTTLTHIGGGAFGRCTALETITLPNGLIQIEERAFFGCTALTSINLPESLMSIGYHVFSESGLTSITWPGSVKVIHYGMFERTPLRTVVILKGVTEIQQNAFSALFYPNPTMTSVTLPSTITVIGPEAFEGQSNLTTITIPDTVRHIRFDATNAFSGCTSLTLASQAALSRVGYTGGF